MNKKVIRIIVALILICATSVIVFFILNNKNLNADNKNNDNANKVVEDKEGTEEDSKQEETDKKDNQSLIGKTLVVYYSATNNTKNVAIKIVQNLNADLFEIIPEEIYTEEDLNYNNPNSRVTKEHDDETLQNVKLKDTEVNNWEIYDTIIIGYPIWWGTSHYVR